MTFEERVQAAQGGDDEAFYSLVSETNERLYRIAFAYLKNEAEALEAIQEVTCRAYMKLRKVKEPRFFYTWLIRILIHYCIDEQKRKRKVLPLLHIPESSMNETLSIDEKILIELAIEKLEPKYQHIIILKYYQDMTLTEIALLLERPEGTIKTWLNKALKELRCYIGKKVGYDYA
jgi:RNA polymerase sigma-70 factor (TIGR02954 family)